MFAAGERLGGYVIRRRIGEGGMGEVYLADHIVEILDCDVHTSGRAYIVMEFLDVETLGKALARIGRFAGDTSASRRCQASSAPCVRPSRGRSAQPAPNASEKDDAFRDF